MCNFFAIRVFVDMGFDTIEKVKKNAESQVGLQVQLNFDTVITLN